MGCYLPNSQFAVGKKERQIEMKTINKGNWQSQFHDVLARINTRSISLLAMFKASPNDLRLARRELNPDRNGTTHDYILLREILKHSHKGEVYPCWLTEWHSSSMDLIDYLSDNFPEMNSANHCASAQENLYRVLCEPENSLSEEAWHEKLEHYLEKLKDMYRINSDKVMSIEAKMKEQGMGQPSLMSSPPEVKGCKRGRNWKQYDEALLWQRDETKKIIAIIRKRYERAQTSGKVCSYLAVVRQMMTSKEYRDRMSFKGAKTWANQACG